MKKLLESEVLIRNLEKYLGKEIDLTNEKHRDFIEGLTGSILMLVPETTCFMVEHGIEQSEKVVYAAIAALGATMKEVGNINLGADRGNHEEFNDTIVSGNNVLKLQH